MSIMDHDTTLETITSVGQTDEYRTCAISWTTLSQETRDAMTDPAYWVTDHEPPLCMMCPEGQWGVYLKSHDAIQLCVMTPGSAQAAKSMWERP